MRAVFSINSNCSLSKIVQRLIVNMNTEVENESDVNAFVPKSIYCKIVLFRIFTGGKDYAQGTSFLSAVQELRLPPHQYKMEMINITQIKDNKWSCGQLVDWLLDSHVHLILSHVHQGYSGANQLMMGWNMEELAYELNRLKHHVGFPMGASLSCPVFTQDKFRYINAVPGFCNPTFQVQLHTNPDYDYRSKELERCVIHIEFI